MSRTAALAELGFRFTLDRSGLNAQPLHYPLGSRQTVPSDSEIDQWLDFEAARPGNNRLQVEADLEARIARVRAQHPYTFTPNVFAGGEA